eukprot:TRINITY_DN14064_c0_g1_i1.p1 TRINITY_DN14064_c0_g1~~TRINITY_DN14064_c0_g1_i1.p1  ORF type:complete len:212 (+),score=30.06 TRINITY_DN14064_c0_g1_i1:16-651(+)
MLPFSKYLILFSILIGLSICEEQVTENQKILDILEKMKSNDYYDDSVSNKILFSKIPFLYLESDKKVEYKRSIPETNTETLCLRNRYVGCEKANMPTKIYCKNIGHSRNLANVQWDCEILELENKNVELDNYLVSCEGFSTRGDPYVLKKSCYLKYSLKLSAKAKKSSVDVNYDMKNEYPENSNHSASTKSYFSLFFVFLVIAGLVYCGRR